MKDVYVTSDLGLASALSCIGYKILELDRSDPRRIIFRFNGEKQDLEKAAREYWDGSLRLPPALLFTHQKQLKGRLYADRS